ncbi:molybdopterin cofactor-binding domain-containing protein [uncultured Ilyobacter sp.]|uniref:xanthine dehydrogenase family protein molybdopterin-binding subunit n=1 Tax=uncultured Ilyobacter sp. TaxID=544433 RepID=UPI0029C0E9A7|nr:molybdopterin cofactor-binding domain-containing protein [uncultured Ilyobacter sp.]
MKKIGIGIGSMFYGIGNTGLPNPAAAFVEVHSDGSATVLAGAADIGQGSNTVMCQIVAEVLGIDYESVNITSADTAVTPEAGATSASRQTYVSGNACKIAAEMAKETLVKVAGEILGEEADKIVLKNKKAFVEGCEENYITLSDVLKGLKERGLIAVGSGTFNPNASSLDPVTMEGNPYATYAFATHIAQVEVETETGKIKVLKIIAAHDVGKAINEINVEGQIEGGCLMGTGFALSEEIKIENAKMQNPNFSKYLIHTSRDMPEIYPVIVEETDITGPFGAKGVGEPTLIPVAPAIINAVYDAIGIRFTELPITPKKVLEALHKM